MKPSLAATLVMVFSSVLANPAPRKCNKQHLMDPPVFTRAEEPSFYVMNPEVPYPYHFHHDVNPYNRHQENMAAAQIQSRAPQTSQTQTPTTTSFFGIGSIPEFGTVTSFSKLFPVSGAACTTASGDEGTCLTQSDCDNQAGTKDGNCGTVFLASAGVCCQFNIRKCSDTAIRSPVTWSPPARAFSKVSCTLTFPANPGLTVAGTTIGGGLTSSSNSIRSCQLKVEFINFRLSGPNPKTTACEDDYFAVSGNAFKTPKLCGDSFTDQTIYLTFNSDQEDITMGFFLSDASNKDWKLKVTRLPCNSPELAPANCLQYFSKSAGQVESFNFRQENPTSVRQLADQDYNICFKQSTGYCSVCFTPCQTLKNVPGFLLTKSVLNGTARHGVTSGLNCPDQLIIPGGTTGGPVRESTYCGAALNVDKSSDTDAAICTTSDRITYITDSTEEPDEVNNVGFCMAFAHKKC